MRESQNSTVWSTLASVITKPRSQGMFTGVETSSIRAWLYLHREALLIGTILLIAGLVHGINMFDFPFYETDEGTYMAQAWAATQGQLSHYTYWYDHAPWGWFQIAGWSLITGGFYTFGDSVNSGRVLMLLFQLGTVYLLYRTARGLSGSVLIATISSLIFALSAYGIYYHRRVLLDNIATFWMMLAIMLLATRRLTLTRVWLSACALGVAILSKEVTIFLVPALLFLLYQRAAQSQRWYAITGWVALVGAIFSTYPLMAALKSELFPTGTFLGGNTEHVSLLGSLQIQMSRGQDGGLFDLTSGFWREATYWAHEAPLLVVGGSFCAILLVLLIRWHRLAGITGLLTLSLWLFLGRGGVIIGFYLLPLLPLLALNLGLVLNIVIRRAKKLLAEREIVMRPTLGRAAQVGIAGLCLTMVLPGYINQPLGFSDNPLTLWENSQAQGQNRATGWIKRNTPYQSGIIIDAYMWLELQDPPSDGSTQPGAHWSKAHWYWRVGPDPEIREGVFENNWRQVDYIVPTLQMDADLRKNPQTLEISNAAMKNSSTVTTFNTGGYPVDIRRVYKFHQMEATDDPVLIHSWDSYKARFIQGGRVIDPKRNNETTSEGQSYALLRSVYMNDRETFDQVWSWTKENLQVRGDSLLAWRWGTPDGDDEQEVLDSSSATDADQDTALALLFAAKRWNEPAYKQQAVEIIGDIWEEETVDIDNQRIIVAGNWARGIGDTGSDQPIVNPSYFAPYAYRIFADADPAHRWNTAVDSSYGILAQIQEVPELGGSAGLVPDWLMVNEESGALMPADPLGSRARVSSFEASRLPWRLTLDWLWNKDNRARQAIEQIRLPRREIQETGQLAAVYNLDGTRAVDYESISMYAGSLGSLLFTDDHSLVHKVFIEDIFRRYDGSANGGYWGDPDNYYSQNWAWFATLLMDGGMGNLWEGQTTIPWDQVLPERY